MGDSCDSLCVNSVYPLKIFLPLYCFVCKYKMPLLANLKMMGFKPWSLSEVSSLLSDWKLPRFLSRYIGEISHFHASWMKRNIILYLTTLRIINMWYCENRRKSYLNTILRAIETITSLNYFWSLFACHTFVTITK